MDWFLYDNGVRHEKVKNSVRSNAQWSVEPFGLDISLTVDNKNLWKHQEIP